MSLMFFFKQKTAYEMRISDWSSDVCSSDLHHPPMVQADAGAQGGHHRPVRRTILPLMDLLSGGRGHRVRTWRHGELPGPICSRPPLPADHPRLYAGGGKRPSGPLIQDRTSVGEGQSVSVRFDLGGRSTIKKKKTSKQKNNNR